MGRMVRKWLAMLAFVTVLGGCADMQSSGAGAAGISAKPGVVIQVSDGDPKTWTQALNVVRNVQSEYGMDKVNIEVVVFGNGIGLLEKSSPQASRISETSLSGAKVLHVREHDEGAEADEGRHASPDRLRESRRDRDHREAEAGLDRRAPLSVPLSAIRTGPPCPGHGSCRWAATADCRACRQLAASADRYHDSG